MANDETTPANNETIAPSETKHLPETTEPVLQDPVPSDGDDQPVIVDD